MRVLVVSDAVAEILHSAKLRSHCEGVGLILSCGDLPIDYLEYLVTLLNVPLLYVHGNHDRPWELPNGRMIQGARGGRDIDERMVCIESDAGRELCVAGLEGSPFYSGGAYQYTQREMQRKASRLRRRLRVHRVRRRSLDVLLTHAAPKGVHDGEDRAHQGFEAFNRLVRAVEPRFLIHGHVHPSYGYDTKPRVLGRTTVISVYRYAFLEIEP